MTIARSRTAPTTAARSRGRAGSRWRHPGLSGGSGFGGAVRFSRGLSGSGVSSGSVTRTSARAVPAWARIRSRTTRRRSVSNVKRLELSSMA
jgi:hypothetical protein